MSIVYINITMNGEREYQISMRFNSYESMLEHLQLIMENTPPRRPPAPPLPIATQTEPPARTAERRENERRGAHTALYHELARQYRLEHPELSYRECYKIISRPPADP